jgi:hypothetical protein
MRTRLTARPKWRQTMARAAGPQSISSAWRTKGNERILRERLTYRPSSSKGARSWPSSTSPSTCCGPTSSTEAAAGRSSSAKSSGTRTSFLCS